MNGETTKYDCQGFTCTFVALLMSELIFFLLLEAEDTNKALVRRCDCTLSHYRGWWVTPGGQGGR